ncbi:hypothetical protein HETIRDRAFT_174215 [Heterobasidion irregulare TC 32-1]|uniref:Uncharacterized protein n=1 Tax=Heterobasidion irregulare (strain TC 32-1) TaxID=747525 RepID=W4JUB9_HETIT|nr:uncharacterized protein HETIRDRAFT_174215 [Heterobasidion irregulare TC 32-1]ETW77147.1 hypothetical protein HETIRDRAFT_174215 [Heterobasidion irregulare TC 32-1]
MFDSHRAARLAPVPKRRRWHPFLWSNRRTSTFLRTDTDSNRNFFLKNIREGILSDWRGDEPRCV